MVVAGLDIVRQVVKDDVDINMDEFNSDEENIHLIYAVSVREDKTIVLEHNIPTRQGAEYCI